MTKKLIIEMETTEATILVFDDTDFDAKQRRRRMETADDCYSCLLDIQQEIRRWWKYHPDSWTEEQVDFAYELSEKIIEIINESNVNMELYS